jgi:hypothetical protein
MISRRTRVLLELILVAGLLVTTVSGFQCVYQSRRGDLQAGSSRLVQHRTCLAEQLQRNDHDDRRSALLKMLVFSSVLLSPQAARAGEVGARITRAVTTSDLGIAVRRSVVQGAQVMDGVDGQWEQFSDRFGLGAERTKQLGRPLPKDIPPPKPLDVALARAILETTDRAFQKAAGIRDDGVLTSQIDKVARTVRPSFERSGQNLLPMDAPLASGVQFNFVSYTHFKAYSDLLIERNIDFPRFKKEFERTVGQDLVGLFLGKSPLADMPVNNPDQRRQALQQALDQVDRLCKVVVDRGLVALIDTETETPLDAERIVEWSEDLLDLSWSIGLDGDVTLGSQLLLQEQGFRLYPNYARYAIQTILESIRGQQISIDDYYMDTDYNSDPDKFEVKQVLVNIVLENI